MSRKSRLQAKQNAQHSTGPTTEAGKAISSRNSLRHGLSASVITALPGEDIQDFLDLTTALNAEHKPTTPTEEALVTKIAQSIWLGQRAVNMQERLFLASATPDPQLLSLYMRYQTTHDRAFSRSLKELQTIRKEARKHDAGFVSQTQNRQLHIAKISYLNARTAGQETNTVIRKARHPAPVAAIT